MTVGVLALQGDFAEHIGLLSDLEVTGIEVRTLKDLSSCSALIIPGGESTVIGKMLDESGIGEEIKKRNKAGTLPIFATCAGVILIANEVTGKNPPLYLDLLDIVAERNAYGTQLQSFETDVDVEGIGNMHAIFIRAPRIMRTGEKVEVLAKHDGSPVLVKQGDIIASTFHPEIQEGETRLHSLFLEQVAAVRN